MKADRTHVIVLATLAFRQRKSQLLRGFTGLPAGDFRWKLPPGWSLVKIFGGGVLMGAAALVADGCNITQGLTNSATLSLGSLVAFVSMAAGAWRTLWALYLRKG
jgi:hypothetical protein